jgi:hypothetical protein
MQTTERGLVCRVAKISANVEWFFHTEHVVVAKVPLLLNL